MAELSRITISRRNPLFI